MERPLELRTRQPSASPPTQPDMLVPRKGGVLLSTKSASPVAVPISATSVHEQRSSTSISTTFKKLSDGVAERPSAGRKRAASGSPVSAGSAKRLKKEIPDSEPTRYTFPAPVLTITGDGPVFDSNWYRSVLEEPGLMGYRMEDGCALSDAYETLLLNQTRIQYDILILTEIMFQRGFARVPGYHRTADEGDEDWKDCNDDDDDVVNGEDKDNDEA